MNFHGLFLNCFFFSFNSVADSGEWCYYGRNEFLINCHIQEIPENGADVAHLNAVHGPNMLTGNDIRYSRQPWASFGIHSWNAQLSFIFLIFYLLVRKIWLWI